jgi:hypothetical protein
MIVPFSVKMPVRLPSELMPFGTQGAALIHLPSDTRAVVGVKSFFMYNTGAVTDKIAINANVRIRIQQMNLPETWLDHSATCFDESDPGDPMAAHKFPFWLQNTGYNPCCIKFERCEAMNCIINGYVQLLGQVTRTANNINVTTMFLLDRYVS